MEHFIQWIQIIHVRHLENITINLGSEKRQHLILTGKNGSGKTSVLDEIRKTLLYLNQNAHDIEAEEQRQRSRRRIGEWSFFSEDEHMGIEVSYKNSKWLFRRYLSSDFVTAFFPAIRPINYIVEPQGVERVDLKSAYAVTDDPARDIAKYMVHLKTQQLYAKDENDVQTEQNIEAWFKRFEEALKILMDDASVCLKYEYKKYSFEIQQAGREQVNFNQLSDGYSSVFRIFSDLLMRMEQKWLSDNRLSEYNKEGVVLIDELETHLHLELQRTILPALIKLFPRVQFIVSTHSPFIIGSIENVVIYDLEHKTLVNQPQGLTDVPYEGIVEGYFRADELSVLLREKYERFKKLVAKKTVADDDLREISQLEIFLDEIPDYLALDVAAEYKRLKAEFEAREDL